MKTQNKTGKNKIIKASDSENIMSLAHAGTKEAVAKLEKIIVGEKDADKKAVAELALEECQQIYYEPKNEKEEADFYLLALANRKDRQLEQNYFRLLGLECEVKFAEQEVRVAKANLKTASTAEKEKVEIKVWATQDILTMSKHRLQEVRGQIADSEAFIETAKKLVVTQRYKTLPNGFMDSVHFDDEGSEDLFEDFGDDDEDFCPSCCGGEDCCPLGDDELMEDIGGKK